MHVLAVRRPGQRGTRKQVAAYGDRLICIRYRYDAEKKKRYKTAELIIEETTWTPPPPHPAPPEPGLKVDYLDDLEVQPRHSEETTRREVGVKVFFRENALRERVKAAGGRWSKSDKLWQVPYETALSLGLEHRIAKR